MPVIFFQPPSANLPPTQPGGLEFWVISEMFLTSRSYPPLKLTASLHPKMDGCKTPFLLGWLIFKGELLVSGRVCNSKNPCLTSSLCKLRKVSCISCLAFPRTPAPSFRLEPLDLRGLLAWKVTRSHFVWVDQLWEISHFGLVSPTFWVDGLDLLQVVGCCASAQPLLAQIPPQIALAR